MIVSAIASKPRSFTAAIRSSQNVRCADFAARVADHQRPDRIADRVIERDLPANRNPDHNRLSNLQMRQQRREIVGVFADRVGRGRAVR